jgi:8-oxo-dGTP pyrophosphatase MutT (NUDIX family)
MIHASGILITTPARQALFLKRAPDTDSPGTWALPGGKIEGDETPQQAAIRETAEETSISLKPEDLTFLRRAASVASVTPGSESSVVLPSGPSDPDAQVDFTTFTTTVPQPVVPTLCHEHTAWCYASLDNPPEPLHPGVRETLTAMTRNDAQEDELSVARAIASGDRDSPQRYDNVTLFAMRITGTGVAYRSSLGEFVFRNPKVYLNDEFLARCNGLSVIMEHPKDATLNSDEFTDRIIGSIMLPYIKGDEVWGVAKIYDDVAVKLIEDKKLSTSPSVVFRDPSVNEKVPLADGKQLLIEGKPSLLDHLAVCEIGVWDKGQTPSGILINNDSTDGDKTVPELEEAKEVAEKDAAKADAETGEKLDKVLAAMDSLHKRMDAMEAEDDEEEPENDEGEEDEPVEDSDEDEEEDLEEDEPEPVVADKGKKRRDSKKKDGEMPAALKESLDKKADSAEVADAIKRVEAMIPKELSDAEREEMAGAQAKADSVFACFGDSAPRPLNGEDLLGYRKRLAGKLRERAPKFAKVNLAGISDPAAFEIIEGQIYSDAMDAGMNPAETPEGGLREIVRTDSTGRRISTFIGKPGHWMDDFTGQRRRLVGIRQA